MPMDVDAVVAKMELDKLKDLITAVPRGKREQICDDIIEFVEKMRQKYNPKKTLTDHFKNKI